MSLINQRQFSDLRGVVRLVVDATVGVTDLVEKMHHTIQLAHPPLGASRAESTSGLTGFVYRSIRGTTKLVGQGIDAGMAPFSMLLPEQASSVKRDSVVSAINGVYGDHLVETGNPLAIQMKILHAGRTLDLTQTQTMPADVTGKILLFVHGLCLNERHWTREGQNRGKALATEFGYTPLYLRYNTGLHIANNGRALAEMLESLLSLWPHPVTELVIVGHSMGGLVARSACHHGVDAGFDWVQSLSKMVSIGTPHHGAPLERGSNWLDYAMDLSPYASPFTHIGRKRSAGITDLRHGSITDKKQDFITLPADVECYAMASCLGKKCGQISEKFIGDGLVPVDSALGVSKDPYRTLLFPKNHQWVGYETGHLELLGSDQVYAQLQDWLE